MKPTPERGFNLIQFSVDHPHIIIAFYLAMLVLGIWAIGYYMPRRFMPYVESPQLGIVTEMPGLSAEEMETYFSSPIELRMTNVPNVRFIRSISQEGFSLVVLEFPYGTDMQRAQTEVQSLLNIVQADLPVMGPNLRPSWIVRIDPLNIPVLTLSLTGDESRGWTLDRLRDLADNEILNRLKLSSKNVYTVSTFGGYRRQLQVQVDRTKLRAYGLSILDIREVLDRYNVAKPAGRVTSETTETVFRVDTLARSAEDIAQVPLKAQGDQVVRIADVAEVVDAYVEPRSAYHHLHSGRVDKAIAIHVLQNPDASSPETIASVLKTAKELEKEYPGISLAVAYDNSVFVGVLFHNMYEELILAILLTGVTVLFFLGEWRGTLIALTAIPTSLAMSLLAMALLGMSLNSSTLIGLLIAIGRLVDDAIIDIHAVERHLRMGKSKREATIDGITEVRRSVFAATIVLIIAMIPLMLAGGITQLMFVGLCLPIIFGLAFSFLVSITLTAVLCSRFMQLPEARAKNWLTQMTLDRFEQALTRLEGSYERLIRWMLKHRFVNLSGVGVVLILGFTFYYFIGSEMMPLGDVGQASLQMEMQPGASFADTERAVEQLEKIMLEEGGKQGWIRHASIEIGQEIGPGTIGGAYFTGYNMMFPNGCTAMLSFSDKDTGRPDIWSIIDRIQERALKEIPGIRRLQIKEMGSDVMATALAPVAVVLYGPDLVTLNHLGKQVLRIAEEEMIHPRTGKRDLAQPFMSWDMTKPSYTLDIDLAKAARHGLTPADIAEQAYYALAGGFTMEFYRLPNRRPMTLQVRYKPGQWETPEDLKEVFVVAPSGAQVPLLDLVTPRYRPVPTLIEHDQLKRVVSIGGYYRKDGRPSMDLTMDLMMKAHQKVNFPPGYGMEARGDMKEMMDSFRRMLGGLLLALVMMYLILCAQFGGFLQPFQMILSLPLELSGVFALLWLMNQSFSTVSILGVIVLSGMDIVTAILMIDLIMRFREEGLPRNEAVARACPVRLRPILMTALITIFVMAQIAFRPKSGLDAYQPLGTVVVGGLTAGTLLSLLVIPIMHTLIDDLIRWIHVKVLKKDPSTLPPVEVKENE
ncbi:MAG: efflux RND transporter permease subunit [Fimbriimonadales bacterium]|nr:efflux RND transporter permease subunit [Fimbriimonadales bacterium]